MTNPIRPSVRDPRLWLVIFPFALTFIYTALLAWKRTRESSKGPSAVTDFD